MPDHEPIPTPVEVSKRVIVVDGDPLLRRYLAHALQLDGIAVRLTADGAGLRSALDHEVPDVIVLNVVMRDDCWLDLCRELRMAERTANTVIIVTSTVNASGVATRVAAVRAVAAGANRFLPTGGSIEVMVGAVKEALGAVLH